MQIIETPDLANNNSFAVKKFIKMDESNFYAVIQPFKISYKIKINKKDYQAGLRAYRKSKLINCYPIDGKNKENTFEKVVYNMELKDKFH